jgi:N-acetylglucosaminyl-diphospho-decaprenol L-rhamnosyltransferase
LTEARALTPPRAAVVLVAWNSAAHLQAAIRSVPGGVPVIVVDNASSDTSAALARAAGAFVVDAGRNLGFGTACNRGVAACGPLLGARPDTILFLNPDAALVEGRAALDVLLNALDADPGLAAAAPRLVGEGQERFQLRRLPTLRSLSREAFLVNRVWPQNRGLLYERYLDRPRDTSFDVEQPAAAALLVRRTDFEAVGGFDPAFAPAWFEDVDLCARLRKSGRRIRYVPAALATHVGGTAMNALPYRDYLPLYTRNLLLYLSRHGASSTRLLYRGVLASGALLRLCLLPFVKGDHERKDAAAAYGRVLRGLCGLGWRTALLPGGR